MNVYGELSRGITGRVGRKGRDTEGGRGSKYATYTHEDSIMKPTKHCLKKVGEVGGKSMEI
jgi:hypothetical protein